MSDCYCVLCVNVVKRKNRKKHFKSKSHNFLSVVHKLSVKNLRQDEVEKTSGKYIADHRIKFVFFNIIVKWKVRKSDNSRMIIKKNITDKVNQILHGDYNTVRFYHVECGSKNLDRFLLSKILSSYLRPNQIIILEMQITFMSEIKHVTYQQYLAQPKQTIEWSLIKVPNKNPKLMADLPNLPLVNETKDN